MMADTTGPTYEVATRCPKCKTPGDVRSKNPVVDQKVKPGTQAHMVYCVNERCTWHNTPWVVQVNPDGSVPPAQDHRGKPKKYENMVPDEISKRLVDGLAKQLAAETEPGAELRRPGQ